MQSHWSKGIIYSMNRLARQLTVSFYPMNWEWTENSKKKKLSITCWRHYSDRDSLSESLERQYSTKRSLRLSSPDHEAGACHLVEGAESRIGLVKMRSDRILICLSLLCRHTDVKGKRRGVWRGGSGYQAFTSDRGEEKKKKKEKRKIYQLIASPQFLFHFLHVLYCIKHILFES